MAMRSDGEAQAHSTVQCYHPIPKPQHLLLYLLCGLCTTGAYGTDASFVQAWAHMARGIKVVTRLRVQFHAGEQLDLLAYIYFEPCSHCRFDTSVHELTGHEPTVARNATAHHTDSHHASAPGIQR
jgi:hypothetical protein